MILKKKNGQKFDKCPICESSSIELKFNTYDRHYLQYHNSYDVYCCKHCGLLFLNPMITEQDLHNLYPKDDYYAYTDVKPATLKKKGFIQKLKSLVIDTSTRDPKFKNVFEKSVLDIGCGSGDKLMSLKQEGWKNVVGVEIDKQACERGRANGINIFNGTIIEAAFPADSFDYVRSNHSFEHIINNTVTVKEMFRVCKPGGKLFIGVPNIASMNFKLFGKYWYFMGIPFHPFGYSPKNLKLLLEKNGFKVEKINYNSSALGILGSMQIALNTMRGIKHSKGMLLNKFFEVPVYQFARILNLIRVGDCIEIIAAKPTTLL